jgi:hypothetical protein
MIPNWLILLALIIGTISLIIINNLLYSFVCAMFTASMFAMLIIGTLRGYNE